MTAYLVMLLELHLTRTNTGAVTDMQMCTFNTNYNENTDKKLKVIILVFVPAYKIQSWQEEKDFSHLSA